MPVFNEKRTFALVIGRLLAKQIAGLEIEIVIVESNSTDGTRDEVRKLEGHPRVRSSTRSGRAARATPCAPGWRTRPATSC